MTMEDYIKQCIEDGTHTKEGQPIKCIYCDSKELEKGRTWYDDNYLCEYEVVCSCCNKTLGSWSYGYWQW